MPYADIATGARLFYEDRGTGEPIILVHGFIGSAAEHFPRVMDWLEPNYLVLGLTLRGYGYSTPKPRDFPLRFYHRDAADVLAFMDALKIEKAHVLGYSDGGETVLVAAGTQPERFKSVMTIGAIGSFGPEMRPLVQRVYPGDWITDEEMAFHGIANRAQFTLGWVNAMKAYIDVGGDISLGLASKITCPLLLMLGESDTLNPVAYGQKLVDAAPQGRLEVFKCGHAIHDEDWDNFQRVISDFLKAIP
ncbi:MAG: alpha/beta hydrolase [Chloroflexota bacterium]